VPKGNSVRRGRSSSHWDVAKRLELRGDLPGAVAEYRVEIDGHGPKRLSAIKELAWLLNRIDDWLGAIELLDHHRDEFTDDLRPLDNLRLNILIKGKQYSDARDVVAKLMRGADARKKLGLIKQDVYCLVALKQSSDAEVVLDAALAEYPGDSTLQELRRRVGTFASDVNEADLVGLQTLGLGLSAFAIAQLGSAALTGADERSKARGYFDAVDFEMVSKFLREIRGRRPRERADVSLTLAYMCWTDPLAAGDNELSELLRRYFSIMAEACAVANSDPDTIRTFATESISLASPGRLDMELPVLFATYVGEVADQIGEKEKLGIMAQRLADRPEAWGQLLRHLPYYESRSPYLPDVLEKWLFSEHPSLARPRDYLDRVSSERERQRLEFGRAEHLKAFDILGVAKMQEVGAELREMASGALFELDRRRLRDLAQAVDEVERYLQQLDYTEKESTYDRASASLRNVAEDIADRPTVLGVVSLVELANKILIQLDKAHREYKANARPVIEVRNTLANDRYGLEEDGTILVSLEVELVMGSPPLDDVAVELEIGSGIRLVEPHVPVAVMRAGQTRELRVRVRPTPEQKSDLAFTMGLRMSYSALGVKGTTDVYSLPMRMDEGGDFQLITNPYQPYSGGSVVADPNMFFGRDDLLGRIIRQVSEGPAGQCFVLYGQKRSGKSSVLSQVSQRLGENTVSVSVTLGEIDPDTANKSFLKVCIEELRIVARDKGFADEVDWPRPDAGAWVLDEFKRVLREARAGLERLTGAPSRIVYLIDEFTYMFEYITEGIVGNAFMRQWKALHESRLISTVVVGQDSMPRFKQAFPNEFGVTHDERISYLSVEAATALAVEPILLGGESRYRGRSLDRLLMFSGRSPWFLQIMCDELVKLMNSRKASLITESDVDAVVRQLVDEAPMPVERFDPLITAAGDSVGIASRESYFNMLAQIAWLSTPTSGAPHAELVASGDRAEIDLLLEDLIERDVVRREGSDRMRINVGLFEQWLRVNRPAGMHSGALW
jgi:hypothetical protein